MNRTNLLQNCKICQENRGKKCNVVKYLLTTHSWHYAILIPCRRLKTRIRKGEIGISKNTSARKNIIWYKKRSLFAYLVKVLFYHYICIETLYLENIYRHNTHTVLVNFSYLYRINMSVRVDLTHIVVSFVVKNCFH